MNNPNPFLQPQPEGSYKIGMKYGAIILIAGAAIVGINFVTLLSADRYYPKLLIAGIAMFFLGPVFMIFPGKPVAAKPATKDMAKVLMANAPIGHKIAWLIWGLASVGLGFYLVMQLDPNFMD